MKEKVIWGCFMAYKKQEDANAASRRWRKNNPEKQSTIDKRAYKKKKEKYSQKLRPKVALCVMKKD